jgi:methylthioribose-1-phosphate isomerase
VTGDAAVEAVIAACEGMLAADVAANHAIGGFGADALCAAVGKLEGTAIRVLTHCNSGSLATAGYGTALGVVRALRESDRLEHVYCTETRPYNQVGSSLHSRVLDWLHRTYWLSLTGILTAQSRDKCQSYNQGARLTAYEIAFEKMPGTLICDSAAAALMRQGRALYKLNTQFAHS